MLMRFRDLPIAVKFCLLLLPAVALLLSGLALIQSWLSSISLEAKALADLTQKNELVVGMMNAYNWRIEMKQGMLNHPALLKTLEQAVQKHPHTIFIACHFANCTHDLQIFGDMLDMYPNLYGDISSRLKEIATVPRYAAAFIEKYQDRLLFGSDVGYDVTKPMKYSTDIYEISFRLLETADEHIYMHDLFKYHWPLYGLELKDDILKKLYRDNAMRILR